MTGVEIVLLLAGAAIFIISFFVPDKGNDAGNVSINESEIKDIIERELNSVIDQSESRMEDTAAYIVERTEVALDKLSNEKMMAINEYSDTVMEAIDRNHQEVVFMYDMLNSKSADIKNTIKEADRLEKERKEASYAASDSWEMNYEGDVQADYVKEPEYYENENRELDFRPIGVKPPNTAQYLDDLAQNTAKEAEYKEEEAAPKQKAVRKGRPKLAKTMELTDVVAEDTAAPAENRNDRILSLHRDGKSNVEIARELGLGMGEVKLVIDLFEGRR